MTAKKKCVVLAFCFSFSFFADERMDLKKKMVNVLERPG